MKYQGKVKTVVKYHSYQISFEIFRDKKIFNNLNNQNKSPDSFCSSISGEYSFI